jgi:hypothetical protein
MKCMRNKNKYDGKMSSTITQQKIKKKKKLQLSFLVLFIYRNNSPHKFISAN